MSDSQRPPLTDLVRRLDVRYRLPDLLRVGTVSLTYALAVALAITVLDIVFGFDLPLARLVTVIVGLAAVASLFIAGVRRVPATRLLIDADRVYDSRSLLISGHQFLEDEQSTTRHASADEAEMRRLVIAKAESFADQIDPAEVYPVKTPRLTGSAAALAVVLLIAVVLRVSGWFDRDPLPVVQQGLELRDAGRRLADRSQNDAVLEDLARQMQDLGERITQNAIDPDEAQDLIQSLGDQIEEQLRQIERTPPFERNEEAIPPESEDTIRSALQRGMGQEEIQEFFTQMRSEGNTVPEMIDALEEATPDRAPDANLGLDEEQVQNLMDQLNRPPADDTESDIVNQLEESRRIVEQTGEGLAEITEGEDLPAGPMGDSGVSQSGGSQGDSESREDAGTEGEAGGQQGGTLAVEDTAGDDFGRIADASPIFRELQGIVTDNTTLDVIIRELPNEATSRLTEQERAAEFTRVVEQAITREGTPPELQRLVRNYFLRVTRAGGEAEDE